MLADGAPPWLVAWREQQDQPAPPPAPKPARRKPVPGVPQVPLRMKGQAAAIGILEPDPWPFDGCKRREPVLDEDRDYSVVRRVGWHHCLKCRRPYFSEDVIRQRMCAPCRGDEDRFS